MDILSGIVLLAYIIFLGYIIYESYYGNPYKKDMIQAKPDISHKEFDKGSVDETFFEED